MKRWIMAIVLLAGLSCAAIGAAGCGSVELRGEALTAAENSTMDAYQAVQRSGAAGVSPAMDDPTGETPPGGETPVPQWVQAYLLENFKQWRLFVRSARKDAAWGPKLAGE